jgi:hypothetical protein
MLVLIAGVRQRLPDACQEAGLIVASGHLHALEFAVEPDVDVEVAVVLVEVEERARATGEATPLTLAQLGESAQLGQQFLYPVKIFLGGMPHRTRMTPA